MLDELRIRGLGVIDEATLPLGPGLTVVTGETGAGKTMVITGLLLLFGSRADAARVRGGMDQASVEGRVLVDADSAAAARARAAGGQLDEDGGTAELLLRRTVAASGRSRAYVGGVGAPIAVLAELAESLLVVHGQSDQLRLTRPGAQRHALDRYGGIDLEQFATAYAEWRGADAEYTERVAHAAELRRESDLLTHGIAEIDEAEPQPGEAEQLAELSARLGSADALRLAATTARHALMGDPEDSTSESAVDMLAGAARTLAHERGADRALDELADRLANVAAEAADLGAELGAYAEQLDADPRRIEEVEARRAVLAGLLRKYCDEPEPSVDGVLRWAATARERLLRIDVSDDALARLRARRDAAAMQTADLAATLSAQRRDAAQRLADAVTAELAGLAMADARLVIDVRPRTVVAGALALDVAGTSAGVTADGADEVEFQLQAHPGAPPLALGRGASGGELSRVMLALELSLADSFPVPTLIFDEVDAGVGGRAAVEVGRRLARLARDRQVLVVTHLAQVAAFADRHVVVDKPTGRGKADDSGVTASDVRLVTADDRVRELARMLAGSDTEAAREHATELLADAQLAASSSRGPTP